MGHPAGSQQAAVKTAVIAAAPYNADAMA